MGKKRADFVHYRGPTVARFLISEVPLYNHVIQNRHVPPDVISQSRHLRVNAYRGTSLIRKRTLLGPYSRTTPRALWWSWGGWHFRMSEVPLYGKTYPTPGGSSVRLWY